MTDDFSDHPETLGEARAKRSEHASDWTPRDALINLLRDIDSGRTTIDAVFIAYLGIDSKDTLNDDNQLPRVHYSTASAKGMGRTGVVGILESAKTMFIMGE